MLEIKFSKEDRSFSKLDFDDFLYETRGTLEEVLIRSMNRDTGTEYCIWHSYNELRSRGWYRSIIKYCCSGARVSFKSKKEEIIARLLLKSKG